MTGMGLFIAKLNFFVFEDGILRDVSGHKNYLCSVIKIKYAIEDLRFFFVCFIERSDTK